jgi:Peptidase A4 family
MRTRVLRLTRVGAVTALLAVTGLAAAASTGTAKADGGPPSVDVSGYVSFDTPFSSASADFTVPHGTCSRGPGETGPRENYWVGIAGTSGVVQTGFQVECVSGQTTYAGWHADLAGNTTLLSQPMQPGDQVYAAVDCGFGVCDETVQDVTQNWNDTISLAASDPVVL